MCFVGLDRIMFPMYGHLLATATGKFKPFRGGYIESLCIRIWVYYRVRMVVADVDLVSIR